MDMYARELNRIVGIGTSPRSIFFADSAVMADALLRDEIDMVNLPALDFLRVLGKAPIEPVFVSSNQIGEKQERCLLVRKDGGISRLDHLKGKSMMIPSSAKDEISSLWFETLLAREGLPDSRVLLGVLKEVNKTSQGVMNLFFRQADAALVTRSVFDTMTQLNPQIGEALLVSTKSKPFLGFISCMRKNLDPNLKQLIKERAVKLHENQNLKQMFILLQTDRIIYFQSEHLENLSELWRESQNIGKNTAKRR
jgi:phosphonate transport system substrate-binding protein